MRHIVALERFEERDRDLALPNAKFPRSLRQQTQGDIRLVGRRGENLDLIS